MFEDPLKQTEGCVQRVWLKCWPAAPGVMQYPRGWDLVNGIISEIESSMDFALRESIRYYE